MFSVFYTYMIHHNISSIELDSDEKMYSYFNPSDLQLVIQFILTQLIPAMQNENIDMDVKYGGSITNLINQINNYNSNDSGFRLNINHNYVPVEMDYYIDMANEMRDLLQKSLDLNRPILVSYTD
jgi:type 1 glutamine amidotransferase